MPRAWLDYFATTAQIAQTAPRLWQSPTTLSFRGAKRRGNPLNRNVNTVTIANDLACSRNLYRAENLCYQFEHGQKLLPQFRKIVCLVCAPLAQADERKLIQGILIHGMCIFRVRAATAARNWSVELSSHTSSFCFNHNKLQLFALALCAPLPTRQKTSLSSLICKH